MTTRPITLRDWQVRAALGGRLLRWDLNLWCVSAAVEVRKGNCDE